MTETACLETACRFSPWLQQQTDSGAIDADVLQNWLPRPLTIQDFHDFADWGSLKNGQDEAEIMRGLRRLRRYVVAHIIVRDLCRVSDLAEVTRTITELADFAVNTATDFAHRHCAALYGEPVGRYSGTPQRLTVVAMGKAGGFELNVSSDLDLIFVYPEGGDTDGRRSKSNQEFFGKVGQKIIYLLNEATADGFVFRIDMRLRPDGDAGALVLSETALEQYLQLHGREWERYAWCKARVVTPHDNGIAALVRPFVFRKYLDYQAYAALRALHGQIRDEVQKKGMAGNIKLGAGGIREVEFTAQIFQMIRGGQNRALQRKGTQETLGQLAQSGILPEDTVTALLAAYRFLRDVEHRLQYWQDQQTQTLPENPQQQQLLAQSMGFTDYAAFSGCLNAHREQVNRIFNGILGEPEADRDSQELPNRIWQQLEVAPETAQAELSAYGFQAAQAHERLHTLKHSSRYRNLSATAAARIDTIMPRLIEAAAAVPAGRRDDTLLRLTGFLENISRRSAYLAFLQQHPAALGRVAALMAQSSWLADYLQRHPILLDELLSDQLTAPLNWPQLSAELSGSLNACDDIESKMDVLRRFQHAQTFRLTVQDLAGQWTVEALSDELSLLADTVLEHTLVHAWQSMPKTHRPDPQFAIIGYGKLGGKELGYTSDLDLVYLYRDDHPDAADCYTKLARRLTTWLSGSTGAGTLYETDLRLRPNGESGFLVHSFAAFEKYQCEQAWTWEHQALTRARFICGAPELEAEFERIRRGILTQERDVGTLKRDILDMRAKIAATHPPADEHVKHARGGIVDVEFIVQYLILAHSRQHPALLENYGNIALLQMAATRELIDSQAATAARDAYRRYRAITHNKKLRDLQRTPVNAELLADYAAVRRLWQQVFGEEAA